MIRGCNDIQRPCHFADGAFESVCTSTFVSKRWVDWTVLGTNFLSQVCRDSRMGGVWRFEIQAEATAFHKGRSPWSSGRDMIDQDQSMIIFLVACHVMIQHVYNMHTTYRYLIINELCIIDIYIYRYSIYNVMDVYFLRMAMSSWALERTCSEIAQAGGDPIEHAWNAWLTAHPVWLQETPDRDSRQRLPTVLFNPLRTTILLVPILLRRRCLSSFLRSFLWKV